MNLDLLTDNPQAIIAICAALSVFSAIVVLSWPYLARDELGSRMRQISSERERIRARERAKMEAQKETAQSAPQGEGKDQEAGEGTVGPRQGVGEGCGAGYGG